MTVTRWASFLFYGEISVAMCRDFIYAIGVADSVSIYIETFGTEYQDKRFIEQYVRDSYDLTQKRVTVHR